MSCGHICSQKLSTLREGKMGQTNFKLLKFYNFSEVFYCGMTRNQKHENLGVFPQQLYIRFTLKSKNMGQANSEKLSEGEGGAGPPITGIPFVNLRNSRLPKR